jgi:hypothetical protein
MLGGGLKTASAAAIAGIAGVFVPGAEAVSTIQHACRHVETHGAFYTDSGTICILVAHGFE